MKQFVVFSKKPKKKRIKKKQGGGGGGGATGACAPPPFHKKPPKQTYFLCRIIRFYTNNPKCQYVYLSFYLNDYQIIDKVNTIKYYTNFI